MLLIYLNKSSSRSKYIFDIIFNHEFGIKYNTTDSITEFESYSEEKINYSDKRIHDEFFVKSVTLLSEDFLKNTEITVTEKDGLKVLFPSSEPCDVGFDIFSSVFYMLSRYEEYLPFIPDKHGRFKGTESFAYRNNFLRLPVADIWINHFKNRLQKKFPRLKFKPSHFKTIVTYDIDVAYKYIGRSVTRIIATTAKDLLRLDFRNIYRRFQTLYKDKKDPWDTYDYLKESIESNHLDSIFFFLLSDKSKHDRNLDFKNPAIKELVNKIKLFSEIGIHPSYKTSLFPGKISTEKKRLEDLSGKNIYKSRQHFLKFDLPATYNALIEAGITEDYSMAFSALPGFRAGTSKSFYFYDLKNEKQTNLKIFPVTLMEDTFMNLKYAHPEESLRDMFNLMEAVKNVDGTFISIWHNHTISETSEYKDWRNVHDKMIQRLSTILEN